MKKALCFICLALISLRCSAAVPAVVPSAVSSAVDAVVPEGAIRFIFDGHLYLQSTLNDTIPVTVIYDTGADFLYLDEDYLEQTHLQDAFGRKAKARMGGAGDGKPVKIDVFVDPVKIQCGALTYHNKMTPVIRLRDILGRYTDGLLGNTHLLNSALAVNFSERYIKQLDYPISSDLIDGYRRLDVRFVDNRIDVKAKVQIDPKTVVEGWFRMDFGCGSAVILTNETASTLDLTPFPKAYFSTQAGGVGGGSEEVSLRAERVTLLDSFENVVIDCSLNQEGALSSDRPYLGIIGNEIWSLYDFVFDPSTASVWVKRNNDAGTYSKASTTHMAVFDRTDICEGWVVNGLYRGGIAEKAGFEIGDIILSINDRSVKEISWEEQRKGLGLNGETKYKVQKKDGRIVIYTLFIHDQII